jgi:glycosyltransferase involved in cell wall biosynthesis
MNSLSIIIPSKNAANLVPCERAIRAAGETCRIIVVDDGIAEWPGDVLYTCDRIPGEKPFNFARNVNRGIDAADTDDVILLNDDALLETRSGFTLLQSACESNRDYGILGSTTDVTGQPLQWRKTGTQAGMRDVGHIAFVCVFIPRRTIDRIGMLDERFGRGSYEDRDYCEQVTRAGLKVGVYDRCFVNHSTLTSTFRGPGGVGYDPGAETKFREKWSKVFF